MQSHGGLRLPHTNFKAHNSAHKRDWAVWAIGPVNPHTAPLPVNEPEKHLTFLFITWSRAVKGEKLPWECLSQPNTHMCLRMKSAPLVCVSMHALKNREGRGRKTQGENWLWSGPRLAVPQKNRPVVLENEISAVTYFKQKISQNKEEHETHNQNHWSH